MATVSRKKIAVKDFGARVILDKDHKDVNFLKLGIVGGIANGTAQGETANGDTVTGLRGSFRFVPAANDGDILTAPVLWLPANIDASIKAALANGASEVRFLFEMAVQRGEGDTGGYVWAPTTLLDVVPDAIADPVAALFEEHAPVAEQAPNAAEAGTSGASTDANAVAKAEGGEGKPPLPDAVPPKGHKAK